MRVVIQRVSQASVTIADAVVGRIDRGLLVLVGFEIADDEDDLKWMSGKLTRLRIFADREGKMNKSIVDIGGNLLVVSQFTLYAATAAGNRPSFIRAARPEVAIPLYETFLAQLAEELGHPVECGTFAADMQISLVNDGPVTITIDSRSRE